MEFNPPQSRLTPILKWTLIVGVALLLVGVRYGYSYFLPSFFSSLRPQKVPMPVRADTVAEGYAFASKLKDGAARESTLSFAQVSLVREHGHFETQTINYFFVPKGGKGRMIMISEMNSQREAYVITHRGTWGPSIYPSSYLEPLEVPPRIEDPQVIEIASTNGLSEFLDRTGSESMVTLTLQNSPDGPCWELQGFGISERMVGKQFHLMVDARTGAVLHDSKRPFPSQ
jgi:hypothetical protein